MCGVSPTNYGLKFQRTVSDPKINKNMRGFSKYRQSASHQQCGIDYPGIDAQILTKPGWSPNLQCYPEIPERMQNIKSCLLDHLPALTFG